MNKLFAFVLSSVGLLSSKLALAAADADIVAVSTPLATSSKENLFAVIQANVVTIGVIFALMLSIYIVIRLVKRVAK